MLSADFFYLKYSTWGSPTTCHTLATPLTRKEICPGATLSTTNPKLADRIQASAMREGFLSACTTAEPSTKYGLQNRLQNTDCDRTVNVLLQYGDNLRVLCKTRKSTFKKLASSVPFFEIPQTEQNAPELLPLRTIPIFSITFPGYKHKKALKSNIGAMKNVVYISRCFPPSLTKNTNNMTNIRTLSLHPVSNTTSHVCHPIKTDE